MSIIIIIIISIVYGIQLNELKPQQFVFIVQAQLSVERKWNEQGIVIVSAFKWLIAVEFWDCPARLTANDVGEWRRNWPLSPGCSTSAVYDRFPIFLLRRLCFSGHLGFHSCPAWGNRAGIN